MDVKTGKAAAGGFTMIELLTVMAVIAILAAMMFPIYNRVKASAQNAAATDLCAQTAAAWNTLLIDNRRFPSTDLIKSCIESEQNFGGFSTVGGDIVFRMSPGAGNLLNWWSRQSAVPAADKKHYSPQYVSGGMKGKSIPLRPGDDGANVQYWPPDGRFERDVAQKRMGVFAPWVRVSKEDALGTNVAAAVSLSDIVIVSLDTDGDGRVPVAVSLSGDDGEVEPDGVETIPASSAAWIFRREKNRVKLIKSW